MSSICRRHMCRLPFEDVGPAALEDRRRRPDELGVVVLFVGVERSGVDAEGARRHRVQREPAKLDPAWGEQFSSLDLTLTL